jgi:Flp pilus assembly protein TadG
MTSIHGRRRARALLDDNGSATAEMVLVTPLLIIMLLFIVFCGRLADTTLRLNDAAHQAARAASLARTTTGAQEDARSIAQAALADAGIRCQALEITIDTVDLQPGSTVTVDISCTVGLSDLALLGVPGQTTLSASSASPIDSYRGEVTASGGAG